jgi:alkylhydroperoxidase/carboxymuconolactone decarboxylase family protein YurZ
LREYTYCANTHGAIAKYQLGGNGELVGEVVHDPGTAKISGKMKSLLAIAAKVQKDGKKVTPEDIAAAREQGATDKEIHDAVLIAAAFCMFNRYVDGLATWAPDDPAVYDAIGRQRATEGYKTPPFVVS